MPAVKPRVIVAEEIAEAGLALLAEAAEVDSAVGAPRDELLARLPGAAGLVVRSATRVDAELIAAAPALRVVGRAGTGTDNIDLEAATRAGVLVVNAPDANSLSAAEQTLALLLALARRVPEADRSVRSGGWERKRLGGVELAGKTLGIVGLGRIGRLVAERARAFGMHLLVFDPFVSGEAASALGAERAAGLEDLMAASDFVTLHVPLTPETQGLVGEEALRHARPGLRLVNTARGGIVDEEALAAALRAGRVAGAAFDVFASEPPEGSPLLALPQVVVTPHLGASTEEAQEKAGVAVAKSVRLALGGDLVPDAVNVSGGAVAEEVKPGIELVETLGRIFTAIAGAVPVSLDVDVRGEITRFDVGVWGLAAQKGIFRDITEDPVTYVNAPLLAKERGCEVRLLTSELSEDFRNVTTLRGTMADGTTRSVSGTLTGPKMVPKVTEVDGFDLEIPISRHMAFFGYVDRPGVIGVVGQLLGEARVNIAGMQVSRHDASGRAMVALTVDSAIPPELVDEIQAAIGTEVVRVVNLV